jgi:hypothetical protein
VRQVVDGIFGSLTVAAGVALMLYGAGILEFWSGLWACLMGGYIGMGVFESGNGKESPDAHAVGSKPAPPL